MFYAKPRGRRHHAKPSSRPPLTEESPPSFHPAIPPALLLELIPEPTSSPPPPYALLYPSQYDRPPQLPARPPQAAIPASYAKPKCGAPKTIYCVKPRKAKPSLTTSKPSSKQPQPIINGDIEALQESVDPEAEAALYSLISTKLDAVITSIDGEVFAGEEKELVIGEEIPSGLRGGWGNPSREVSRGANRAISSAIVSTNYFAKVNLYANSKLPSNLPPLQL